MAAAEAGTDMHIWEFDEPIAVLRKQNILSWVNVKTGVAVPADQIAEALSKTDATWQMT